MDSTTPGRGRVTAGGGRAGEGRQLSRADRVRLAETFRIGERFGDEVWNGWSRVPFAVLLVSPEREFLVRHPRPSKDFTLAGHDRLLRSDVYLRDRTFPTNLLAAFPAVGGMPTVVIGRPEQTVARTSTRWVLALLHEHFHQMQESHPRFLREVDALGLARGDRTGKWMLDFPFPYDDPGVGREFLVLCRAAREALGSIGRMDLPDAFAAYLDIRRGFQRLLSPDDYRYFSFQLWLEGVALYTELRIARLASGFRVREAVRMLGDYTSLRHEAEGLHARILDGLRKPVLHKTRRAAFYPLGAAEGLLLDEVNPRWRRSYFTWMFRLEEHYPCYRR